jgi:5-hydroxyisourate hydrolase
VSGRLSTHVLDTSAGRPAADVPVRLLRDGDEVARAVTDADGRAVLVDGDGVVPGVYELVFALGEHFAATPGFLDEVPVRFRVDEAGGRYHVPLLVSPWSYSTYRGS